MSEIGNVTAEIFVTFMLFYVLTYLKMDQYSFKQIRWLKQGSIVWLSFAFVRSAPVKFAFVRSAPVKFAFVRSAYSISDDDKSVCDMSALVNIFSERFFP